MAIKFNDHDLGIFKNKLKAIATNIDPLKVNTPFKRMRPVLFLKRMMQHVMPKNFQRMRYCGLQATKTFKKYLPMKIKLIGDLVDSIVNATRKLFYAEMFQKTVNRNPFVCRKCSKGMELSCLYHPDRGGTFFDEFAVN